MHLTVIEVALQCVLPVYSVSVLEHASYLASLILSAHIC